MAQTTKSSQKAPVASGGGMAIASFVLGIVSFILGWIPFLPIILAIVGLGLGIADRNSARKALAWIGIALCAVEILWQIFYGGALIKNHGHLQVGSPTNQTQSQ